jgi:hypothetical protein
MTLPENVSVACSHIQSLTGSPVNLFDELSELAGDVGGVAVEDWGVTGGDLTGVVEDNDLDVRAEFASMRKCSHLSVEAGCLHSRIIFAVRTN